ncbi:hypothetical protein CEXT_621941 [Caerostris extrusa]|uniref:Uncharacterized protein n=1 Tax=Caerostris extrusa TaxID=172846 RepID=A0AAV4N7N8_CAEEX|nr:hypothetical protein CEXT_621941 [Caerostris extrusa]
MAATCGNTVNVRTTTRNSERNAGNKYSHCDSTKDYEECVSYYAVMCNAGQIRTESLYGLQILEWLIPNARPAAFGLILKRYSFTDSSTASVLRYLFGTAYLKLQAQNDPLRKMCTVGNSATVYLKSLASCTYPLSIVCSIRKIVCMCV